MREYVIGRLKEAEGRLRAGPMPGPNWPARILTAVNTYNKTYNRRVGMEPDEVTLDNANRVFRRRYGSLAARWSKAHRTALRRLIPLGSIVRIKLENRASHFLKSNIPRNSSELYRVQRIRLHPREGIKYKLFELDNPNSPIAGTWNSSELIRAKISGKEKGE